MATVVRLAVRSYRSIQDSIEINFPKGVPVVLVGENNAGKSNLIRALNLPLGQFWPGSHDPEDHEFFGRDRNNPIHITVEFDEADPLGGRYTEAHWRYKEDAEPPCSFYGFPPPFNREQGWINNSDRDTAACMMIEAERNLLYQLSYSSKYTLLSRMMRRFHQALVTKEDLRTELEKLFEDTKTTFKKLPEFQQFVESLQAGLTKLVSSMTHRLEVDFEAYNPVNFFHALDLHASEEGIARTLEEMGTGEQQVLAMAFAHAYAKAFHSGVVLVVEEPESHLHPLAQQWLAKQFSTMCADGLQIVITTHSAAFIDILNLEGIVLVRKANGVTSVTQLNRAELVEGCVDGGANADKTTEESILPFYAASATREILEGFFAKAVVLVEGPTESLSLPVYLSKAGLDCAKEGIAIIPVHGKGNLAKWHRLFEAYEIPCYIVFDNDGKADDKNGTKRKDALAAVGITDAAAQDEHLKAADWELDDGFAIFGSNFEDALREKLSGYAKLEDEAKESGIDSKPFVARYVAEKLPFDENEDGWILLNVFAQFLRKLIEE
jgi:putative ATP-dependent endonuclease of the OLD family